MRGVGIIAGLNAGFAQLLISNTGEVFITRSIAMELVAAAVIWSIG
jgi:hypothetical protein